MDAVRLDTRRFSDSEWDVVAHTTAELGVGEIARRLLSLLTASGVEVNPVSFEANISRKLQDSVLKAGSRRPGANIISCVNPDQLGALVSIFGESPLTTNKHVGFWAWELEDFPRRFNVSARLLDEIWTISRHSMDAINKTSPVKSRLVRMPVPIPSSKTELNRKYFGLPDNKFIVISSFDYLSDIRRKNPQSTIEAYTQAFPRPEGALLVIKSINGDRFPDQSNQLKELAAKRPDIVFFDAYLNQYETLSLTELADVFISLHRSEGYGINLADAMARKTATVATGYSGNLEFMDEKSSVLIPYELIAVKKYAGLKVDSVWAEPDTAYAAFELRRLYDVPSRMSIIGDLGFRKLASEHSLKAARLHFQKEFMNARV